jgi:quercetin 2,3-dioxygenase
MAIRIIPEAQQGHGAFNGGEILENKPIGFPQDHSNIRPYSNLFYWAHARAVKDSTIGLHPHQGFEICSFVLKGEIKHFDTKLNAWRPLSAGDVQIIRAGNGISHSEWMGKDAEMFQIWFDPNLPKTLQQSASYDDYRATDFPTQTKDEVKITTLVGAGSPFQMDTPGITVEQIELGAACHTLQIPSDKTYSAYVLEGEALFNGELTKEKDFVLISDVEDIEIQSLSGAKVFIIGSPTQPGYPTYSQLR